jgi:hypothetical protein
MNNTKY